MQLGCRGEWEMESWRNGHDSKAHVASFFIRESLCSPGFHTRESISTCRVCPTLASDPSPVRPCREDFSGCHSWSWPGPDQVTPTPGGTAPFPLLLSPPVPRLGKLIQVPSSKFKSLAALPQLTPKLSHSEGGSGGGQEFRLRVWLVV